MKEEKLLREFYEVNSKRCSRIVHVQWRPWLWPVRIINRLTSPIPTGLWILNFVFQRILDINNEMPWMVNFTSRVVGEVIIGKNVWKSFAISGGCYIQGYNGIIIGDDTIFAPGVKIISSNHDMDSYDKNIVTRPIRIGKRCWIGANAVILPGVELGDDVVVGAGAVVTQNFAAGAVIAGIPARLLKMKHQKINNQANP